MEPLALLTGLVVDVAKSTVVDIAKPVLDPVKEEILRMFVPRSKPALEHVRLNLREAIEELRAKDAVSIESLVRSLPDPGPSGPRRR